jgi:hypothetical protein
MIGEPFNQLRVVHALKVGVRSVAFLSDFWCHSVIMLATN